MPPKMKKRRQTSQWHKTIKKSKEENTGKIFQQNEYEMSFTDSNNVFDFFLSISNRTPKNETNVKAYTLNQESRYFIIFWSFFFSWIKLQNFLKRYLIVRNVPSVASDKDLIPLFALYGDIEEYVSDDDEQLQLALSSQWSKLIDNIFSLEVSNSWSCWFRTIHRHLLDKICFDSLCTLCKTKTEQNVIFFKSTSRFLCSWIWNTSRHSSQTWRSSTNDSSQVTKYVFSSRLYFLLVSLFWMLTTKYINLQEIERCTRYLFVRSIFKTTPWILSNEAPSVTIIIIIIIIPHNNYNNNNENNKCDNYNNNSQQ
jgi:hypothetical protein